MRPVRDAGIPFFSALFKAPPRRARRRCCAAAMPGVARIGMTQDRFPMTTALRAGEGADAKSAKTKIAEVVVVCGKCAKRQGLRPRDVRDLLKGAAKRAVRDGRLPGGAKIRVVASGCLGPCPKRALAVATGASLAAGRVLLLDPALKPEAALAAVLPARHLPEFGPIADLAAGHPDESSTPA